MAVIGGSSAHGFDTGSSSGSDVSPSVQIEKSEDSEPDHDELGLKEERDEQDIELMFDAPQGEDAE